MPNDAVWVVVGDVGAGDAGAALVVVPGAGAAAAVEADELFVLPVDAAVVAGGVLSTVSGAAGSASVTAAGAALP